MKNDRAYTGPIQNKMKCDKIVTFSQHCCWGFKTSGMLHYNVKYSWHFEAIFHLHCHNWGVQN